jgi:hypothetical protein
MQRVPCPCSPPRAVTHREGLAEVVFVSHFMTHGTFSLLLNDLDYHLDRVFHGKPFSR